jgi:carboxymethylenebutenolidase
MCHDDDSRPPSPPVVGEVTEHGLLELTAVDGNTFAAYHAEPAQASSKNIVILPDVRGLHPFYEAMAIRFAEAGFNAVALDYFGRSNGISERDDDFDWQSEIRKVRPEQVDADAGAAVAYLTERHPGPVFSVGFCFGGSQSWRLSASDLPLAGCMGFYGRPSMIAAAEPNIHKPLLLLVAGADAATPAEQFVDFDRRLTEAGREHETYIYDGAPHSFFDRSFGEWEEACQDSWRRMLAFTAAHG